jgi:Domain of unknown function (DUF932)
MTYFIASSSSLPDGHALRRTTSQEIDSSTPEILISKLRLAEAREALNIVYEIADDFAARSPGCARQEVSDAEWAAFLDAHEPIPEDKGRARTMAETKREPLTRPWSHDNRVAPWHGTAWGVMRAVNT